MGIYFSESIQTYKWVFEFLKSNRVCNGEWILTEFVADNAQCISIAQRQVFPGVKRRNCFAHMNGMMLITENIFNIMSARTGPGRPRGHTQALSRN